MGLFSKTKPQATGPRGQAPLASGRRLRSRLAPADCGTLLEGLFGTYRERKYPGLPLLVPAGVRWTAADGVPALSLAGDDQAGDFLLITLSATADGSTEAGIFPLGSGDDRLQLPVIGNWKMRDGSLSSTGLWPSGTAFLTAPPIGDRYVDDTLAAAGYPATSGNRRRLADMLFRMIVVKGYQFIESQQGTAAARRFSDTQQAQADWSNPVGPLRAALQAMAEWNSGVLPYIQDLPPRVRAIALEATESDGSVWKDMDIAR